MRAYLLTLFLISGCERDPLLPDAPDGAVSDLREPCGEENLYCCRGTDCAEGLVCRRTWNPSGGGAPYCRVPRD